MSKECYTIELLDAYQQSACVLYAGPQRKALSIWRELSPRLLADERRRLQTERAHHRIGEGRSSFDSECQRIRERIKRDLSL